MFLAGYSDMSLLLEFKARSRIDGNYPLYNNSRDPPNNGDFLTVTQIIKAVMSSATKVKLGALYINCPGAIPTCHTLITMEHPYPPTPMKTVNTTALGVVRNTIDPRRTNAMDMHFHWLRCRKAQQKFRHYWRPGLTNNSDYVTKHQTAVHH